MLLLCMQKHSKGQQGSFLSVSANYNEKTNQEMEGNEKMMDIIAYCWFSAWLDAITRRA